MQFLTDKKIPQKAVRVSFATSDTDEIVRRENGSRELVIGIESRLKINSRKFFLLARRIIQLAKEKHIKELAIDWEDLQFPKVALSSVEMAEAFVVNALMSNFTFTHFKTPPKKGFPSVDRIYFLHARTKELRQGFDRGNIIGDEVNRARLISNMPGGEMTPEILAEHARASVRNLPILVRVLGMREMQRLKMGGVIAVGKGSDAKPRFIILEYRGTSKSKAPIVLIGKGITFDTGGINLKPSDSIIGMNMDMSGGAAVIHTLAACARLKFAKNIVALIPAAENMPSGESYRPGDIIRSLSGKTIEVQNTDAEGRIVLADALTYAKRYRPSLVVDVATLTGAVMVALGERAAGLFTQDEKLELAFRHIGESVGDFVWPLPLWDEYDEEIKAPFGDVANLGTTKWGGAITAAAFLKQFADGYPWVHLDIASRMTAIKGEYLAPGAAGAAIRLLIRYLERF